MAEWTRTTPWRQGHLLTPEAAIALKLAPSELQQKSLVIVASHDCDLAQSPENEPDVEVIVGQIIETIDGNFAHAKTARTLHIQFDGADGLMAAFVATDKRIISKQSLAEFSPDIQYSLSPEAKTTFQRWLAARYRRSAFPDEFERRLNQSKLAEKISRAVKPCGNSITAVLFDVNDGEEKTKSGDDIYVLYIYLLHGDLPSYEDAEKAAVAAKNLIERAFKEKLFNKDSGQWQLIELRDVDVISEEVLTYRQFTQMKPWRLEHISLGANPQSALPAE
jgi:hypothetical protein